MSDIADAMGTRGFWTSQPDAMGSRGFWAFLAQAVEEVPTDKLIETIYNLIQGLGKTVTITSGGQEYVLKITPPYPCHDRLEYQDLIKYGDCMGFLPNYNLSFTPSVNDEVDIDGATWGVTGLQRVIVNGQIGLYGLLCEKYGNTNITPSSLWTRLDRRLVPSARKVIDKLGVTTTFHAASDYDRRCVIMPRVSDGFYRSNVYRKGDIRLLLPSEDLPFQPKYGLMVTHNSKKWIIEKESPIYSGEQVVTYELQIRR